MMFSVPPGLVARLVGEPSLIILNWIDLHHSADYSLKLRTQTPDALQPLNC